MRHFYRSQLGSEEVLAAADDFFARLTLDRTVNSHRARAYAGKLGNLKLKVEKEGGHYTFVEVSTDQTGESRLDRNVKRFFVELRTKADPRHRLRAAY
ncbi:MAG TPA: hypothetical protein VMY38_07830 [Gemmatimonadaceae bacterium]|nr:hypothetical protein [Gemmatimonadaceae bacterium]